MPVAKVHRISAAAPDDVRGIEAAIAAGKIDPNGVMAVLGKTEGNGLVNDFARGYAALALSLMFQRYLSADQVSKICLVMSGGTEGGMSTGEPLRIRAAFKPLSTLMKPLQSVDIRTKEPVEAAIERSDVCAIPAAAVIAESVVAFVVAQAFLEKFGGDSLTEIRRNYDGYLEQIRQF